MWIGQFLKIFSNFRKFGENWVILLKISPKIGRIFACTEVLDLVAVSSPGI